MKSLLIFVLTATVACAENLTAIVVEETRMNLLNGKSSIVLKAGTNVEVVSQDGDSLTVIYRKIQGHVPISKTDFKGDATVASVNSKDEAKPGPTAPANPPPAAAKSASAAPAAPPSPGAPTTNYGKMVQKARDNEAKHKENLVKPANEVTAAEKK
jgi:hypothetical protein